jgi:hypothetical protein
MVEGRDSPVDRQTRAVKDWLEAEGYHLYLHRHDRLVPRRAADRQEGHVCDFFAARRYYREGERIGRFRFAPLSFPESLAWVEEMTREVDAIHRQHAIGMLARWAEEGQAEDEVAVLARRLLADPHPQVAAVAAERLGGFG